MSPDPDQTPIDPEDRDYLSYTWSSLPWSPWFPFTATKEEFRQIPHEPGLYRIRPAGKDFLMYIGETRRTVHERLNELRHTLKRTDLMPWHDPIGEAPPLWAWQDAEGFSYECSAAPLDASQSGRRGMESFLLYRYRQERGASTLCNFGRFHPRYRKSTNRKETKRGGKLAENHLDNPAGGPSIPPLPVTGTPGERDWMGLPWSGIRPLDGETIRTVPPGAGLYLLFERDSRDLVSIGQSADCAKRLRSHAIKFLDGKDLLFSSTIEEKPLLPHNLKELENDLIGNYFEAYRKVPKYQFGNMQ
ncbi:MAG: hypothetical protein NTZ37_02140 [Methanoregula sp.]|nr:hypothetical protein [Methanoregula sp.]